MCILGINAIGPFLEHGSQNDEQNTHLDALKLNESERERLKQKRYRALGQRAAARTNLQSRDREANARGDPEQNIPPLRSDPQTLS